MPPHPPTSLQYPSNCPKFLKNCFFKESHLCRDYWKYKFKKWLCNQLFPGSIFRCRVLGSTPFRIPTRTQNPLVAIPCRFESGHRHHSGTAFSCGFFVCQESTAKRILSCFICIPPSIPPESLKPALCGHRIFFKS